MRSGDMLDYSEILQDRREELERERLSQSRRDRPLASMILGGVVMAILIAALAFVILAM